jgi:hypothetical protein
MMRARLNAAPFALFALLVACSAPVTPIGEPRAASASTTVGAAPMFAVSTAGAEAVAWVSAPNGGTDGRLFISVGAAPPTEHRDSLGPIEAHGEAPPKLVYDNAGALYAMYDVGKVVPGLRYPLDALRLIRSSDGGASWSAPVTVTGDSAFGSHNFHALYAAPDGRLYASWLDSHTGHSGAFITSSADQGRTWATPIRVDSGEACPCCRTAIASASDGALYLAWRAVLPGSIRDIVVARSANHGATWSAPVRVHADGWKIDGCPHAGPALRVDARGGVHVAWWTGREGEPGVFYARSDDAGHTFNPAIPIGVARVSRPSHAQLALGDSGVVVVAWDDGTLKTPRIALRISHDDGRTFSGTAHLSASGRSAAFPVLALRRDTVVVAWTEQSPEAAARDEAAMPDEKDPNMVMGLHAVGEAQVMIGRYVIRDR